MAILYYVYAALLLVGGALGFVLAGSKVSLLSSAIVAALMVVAARLLGPSPKAGLVLGVVCALAVGGFFVSRFAATHKPMPAIPVVALSAVVLAASVVQLTTRRRLPV